MYDSHEDSTSPLVDDRPYPSVRAAVTAYVETRSMLHDIRSNEGVGLAQVQHWNERLDPVGDPLTVRMPRLDGGVGSVLDDLIVSYMSVEACLPSAPLDLRVLLCWAVFDRLPGRYRGREVLAESDHRMSRREYEYRLRRSLRVAGRRLRDRGLVR